MSPGKSRKLAQIKALVATGAYHISGKVQSLLEDGCFEIEDIECCLTTATAIEKWEDDELGVATDGRKYTIIGTDTQGYLFYTCGKILADRSGARLYFFITAHEDEAG